MIDRDTKLNGVKTFTLTGKIILSGSWSFRIKLNL